jgi:hypothetical protein
MFFQKFPQFILERRFPMVLFLIGNISPHHLHGRFARRKRAVAILPLEGVEGWPFDLIHFEDTALSSPTILLNGIFLESTNKMWMWSSTDPIMIDGHSRSRRTPIK